MKRGDKIKVRAYPDEVLDRVVWEVHPTWVMVCRLDVYQQTIQQGGIEPACWMGFPIEDVITGQGGGESA